LGWSCLRNSKAAKAANATTTPVATAAEIGSQRLFGRSTLLALRSMVSDLSNLLLSSRIVHFHPAARCSFRAGDIVLARALSLTADLHVSP
jgi:hypothetical protein